MVSFEPSNHSAWGTGVVIADLGIIFTCRGDYFTLDAGRSRTRSSPASVHARRCRARS